MNYDIASEIAKHIVQPKYKIAYWILEHLKKENSKYTLNMLSINPNALEYIDDMFQKENLKIIDKLFRTDYSLSFFEERDYNMICEYGEFELIPEYTTGLSGNNNKQICRYLKMFETKIDWQVLSENPSAIELIECNIDKIHWINLSKNHNALDMIEEYHENIITTKCKNQYDLKLYWNGMSNNKNAIHILEANKDKIDKYNLLLNENAIELIEEFIYEEEYEIESFSLNPNAIKILENNERLINWNLLSANPNAIKLLRENPEKINWTNILLNPNAIDLIIENQDKIKNWFLFAANPSIFIKDEFKYTKSMHTISNIINKLY
jgi:hypothetical protein